MKFKTLRYSDEHIDIEISEGFFSGFTVIANGTQLEDQSGLLKLLSDRYKTTVSNGAESIQYQVDMNGGGERKTGATIRKNGRAVLTLA